MAKSKSSFFCQNCGAESAKWIGRCPSCGEWNTYVEEIIRKTTSEKFSFTDTKSNRPEKLKDIAIQNTSRINTLNHEFNRVLGGGLVPGSLVLIGGEPGIGKSTLALQIALALAQMNVLYVSGEESARQIKLRAERFSDTGSNDCLIYTETNLERILENAVRINPGIIIIDSVQTLFTDRIESSPGSVSQVRECATAWLKFAKETGIPVILIGHITKDGAIAGPKVLEHIVDTVLQFEGDTNYMYRILRATKNRFGSTSEIGVYEMRSSGLIEIPNPSEILISHNHDNLSGVAVAATIEGIRPLLIEVQALVSNTVYSTPQRSATGFDIRRLGMLLAVLEKRGGFKLSTKDVFLNIAGGLRVDDPAMDMAVAAAILSSALDVSVGNKVCLAGEISLSGEVRPVNRIEQRISEAEKLGFGHIIISTYNKKGIELVNHKIDISFISKVQQLPKLLFG
jgi:DNA repair protein RadA/Sms